MSPHRLLLTAALIALNFAGPRANAGLSMGVKEGGGGDPLVLEFLQIARQIASAIPNLNSPGQTLTQKDFLAAIQRVASSAETQSPILYFPEGRTVTCFGIPKLGCVGSDGRIRIARDGWREADQLDKIELTSMEMSILSGSGNQRYNQAPELARRVLAQGFVPAATGNFEGDAAGYYPLNEQQAATIFQSVNESIEQQQKAFVCSHEYPDGGKIQIGGELRLVLQPNMRVSRSENHLRFLKIEQSSGTHATILLVAMDAQRRSVIGYTQYTYEWQAGVSKNVGTLDQPRYVLSPSGMHLTFTDNCSDHY